MDLQANDPRQMSLDDFDTPEELALHTMRRLCSGLGVVWVGGPAAGDLSRRAQEIIEAKLPELDVSVLSTGLRSTEAHAA